MRFRISRTLAMGAVVLVAGCGGGQGGITTSGYIDPCENDWWLTVQPQRFEVGATATARVSMFAISLDQTDRCDAQVVSTSWTATPPGIVRFSSGSRPYEAVLTGVAPGQATLGADITLASGAVRTAVFINETVRVVPATAPE
jgi:hypothetical protein